MTTQEIIEKIRAEVERLQHTDTPHTDEWWDGADYVRRRMKEVLSDLEKEEKPNSQWSEEDEKMLEAFLHKLEVCDLLTNKEVVWAKSRLKSFHLKVKSEKPIEGLEEEMDKFFETMPVLEHENIFEDTFKNIARHFAKWGAEHLKKNK